MQSCIIFLDPRGSAAEVIRKSKQRGMYTLVLATDMSLLDGLPEPYRSGAQVDELIAVPSWDNLASLLELVDAIGRRLKIVGVYFNLDAPAIVAASLRQHLGLPTIQPATAALITDKLRLRRRLQELGLSRLRTFSRQEVESWQRWELPGAAYFKPVHGAGSAYVKRCTNLDDLRAARREFAAGVGMPPWLQNYICSGGGDYLLEEACEGELMSVEALSCGGDFLCIGLTSRILYSKDPVVEMGSCFPYRHPQAPQIISLVQRAHKELGFTEGPSHTEIIVDASGHAEIIDWNPRFIGADVLQSINHAYGITIEDALLDWALGKRFSLQLVQQGFSCLQYVLPPHSLQFERMDFPSGPEVKFATCFVKPGAQVASIDRQMDYLGCYLVVMPTFEAALLRSAELRHKVQINGTWQGAY